MNNKLEFESYLKNMFPSDKDVQIHVRNVSYFNDWLETNYSSDIRHVSTNDILAYVQHLQITDIKIGTINTRLNGLRKYYTCLIKLGYINRNPALNIYIQGKQQKVVHNPLDSIALNELYSNFEAFLDTRPKPLRIKAKADNFTKLKYKLAISLMIFQGLDRGELDSLHVVDFNATKGTLYINSKANRNSRTLKLESLQMFLFYQYLQAISTSQA